MKMNRRDFLKSSTLAAAAALASPKLLRAGNQVTPNYGLSSITGIIDWHTHWISDIEIEMLSTRTERPYAVTNQQGTFIYTTDNATGKGGTTTVLPRHTDLDARIAVLDQNHIQRQVVGWTIPMGFDDGHLGVGFRKTMFAGWNAELYEKYISKPKYCDRYSGLAALTTADPEWSADQLKLTHDAYGFIGGSLPLNAAASTQGLDQLRPIFEEANYLKSVIFFHRGAADPTIPGQPTWYGPDSLWARSTLNTYYQLTAAPVTLGLSPFLDDYPNVSVVVIMLGGFISFVMDSLQSSGLSRTPPVDALQLFKRIYIEPGPYCRLPQQVAKTVEVFGADNILFGTDYGPAADMALQVTSFNSADLTLQERRQIMVDNGLKILQKAS
jgi:predicted TIM-barrel fold metal-dependent hydrolase